MLPERSSTVTAGCAPAVIGVAASRQASASPASHAVRVGIWLAKERFRR
jgi:hypothetical protein